VGKVLTRVRVRRKLGLVIAHWDEVEWRRRAKGEMDASWQRLGDAAGTAGVGVNRLRIAPGKLSTPPHSHGASEEIVFVLAGSGLSWQDEQVYELGPGDCIVHVADREEHTLRAGPEGLEAIVFGTRHPTEIGWLPRSSAIRIGWPWAEGRTDDPWDVEAEQPPLVLGEPSPRPPTIVNLDDVDGAWRALTPTSTRTGLNWLRLPPGEIGAPPHCHSAEEEAFVVLDGEGTLEPWPSPAEEERGVAREDVPVRAGHVVARPPATRIAHAFRAGAGGLTLLLYGTREGNDVVYYPRSRKIIWHGIGVRARVDHLAFDDGEPD
jgi:uncharacterized cupin superfamily protein